MRDFRVTAEPAGDLTTATQRERDAPLSFVVQKHAASRLHYDFRLEMNGVLVSWACPKGPSFDPADKRIAVHVEDHPLGYADFEGTIPPKQYGAGTVIVWDRGHWVPRGDPAQGLAAGKLVFELFGHKLFGLWELVKIAKPGDKQELWILFKKRGDAHARPRAEYDVVSALPDSVIARPLRQESPSPPASLVAPTTAPAARLNAKAGAGAVKAPLPEKLAPQLATLATGVPPRGTWLFEIKFDGYRLLTRVQRGKATLLTRGGHDWSARMPTLVDAVERLGLGSAWLDGEIVVLGPDGLPNFNALQKAFDRPASSAVVDYMLFDLPYLEGHDLRAVPLAERRRTLKALLDAHADVEPLRFSADFAADATSVMQAARALGLEGVIAKRADAPYVSARSDTWLKLKSRLRQEFVVAGYTDRSDGSAQIGSLLLGVNDDTGALVSVGSVGTGWDSAEAAALKRRLAAMETQRTPFAAGPAAPGRWSRRGAGSERWVRPECVVEVEYAELTPERQIRHASYVGLRGDKPAREVRLETARAAADLAAGIAMAANPAETATTTGTAKTKTSTTAAKTTGAGTPTATVTAAAPATAGRRTSTGPGPTAFASATSSATARRAAKAAPADAKVKVSHGERVIDAASGLTKLDLVRYYESVADFMLPHLRGRPCSLVRGPNGVGGELFFQKHTERTAIPGLVDLDPALWPGHDALIEVASAHGLASAAQMNVIEFHTWNSTVRSIDRPDRMIFDLDPGEGTAWPQVQEAATLVRGLLDALGLRSWLKTSGGKGLHVVVPLTPRHGYAAVKDFSQAVVQHLARVIPQRFVAKSGPANRVGKLFVDYLRNGHGATTAAAYSARARPGLGVSMPVDWDDLPRLKGGAQWTVATAREHLSFQTVDPWRDCFTCRQTLTHAAKALGHVLPAAGRASKRPHT